MWDKNDEQEVIYQYGAWLKESTKRRISRTIFVEKEKGKERAAKPMDLKKKKRGRNKGIEFVMMGPRSMARCVLSFRE